MPLFKYRPYYLYRGPDWSDPFREELGEDDIRRNMGLFFNEIGEYFRDVGAIVEPVGDGFIGITTEIPERDCDERVKRCLNSLDLFAQKLAPE